MFDYAEYESILKSIQSTKKLRRFSEVTAQTKEFIVLRHDVEALPERAYIMAEIEQRYSIRSLYLFQIKSNLYNAFSYENIALIQAIHRMGHEIGLHYKWNCTENLAEISPQMYLSIAKDVQRQVCVFSQIFGCFSGLFSIHRPTLALLSDKLQVDGLIHCNERLYFDRMEGDPQTWDRSKMNVVYLSDAMHRWKYGYPSEDMLRTYPRIHMVIHPEEWTHVGFPEEINFHSIYHNIEDRIDASMRSEYTHYQGRE